MKTFKFIEKPEFPFDSNIFDELQGDINMIESVLVSLVGTGNWIVSGCVVDSNTISAGYLLSGGKLYRFEGGIYYNPGKIAFVTLSSSVQVAGEDYTRYTETIARMFEFVGGVIGPAEIAWTGFKQLSPVITSNFYLSKIFSASVLPDVTGISERYGRVVYSPHFVDVKIRFKVDVTVMSQSELDTVISIGGWDGGSYDVIDNKAGWIGTYKLTHGSMSAIKEMHAGNVRVHQTSNHILQLYKPFTRDLTYSPATPATFDDLSQMHSSSAQTYYVEIEARLTRSAVSL